MGGAGRPNTGLLVVVGLICLAAIALALFAAFLGRGDMILIAAVFTLGLAQLVSMTLGQEEADNAIAPAVKREIRKLRARIDQLETALAEQAALPRLPEAAPMALPEVAVAQSAPAPAAPPQPVLASLPMPPIPPAANAPSPAMTVSAPPAPAVTASAAASERPLSYDLFLEPIVDLAEARTRHYRVHFLAGAEDGDFSMARPSAGPQVEMLAIRRALPVAEHLLGRGRDAKLFCRAGAQAFGDADFIDEMLHLAASRPKLAKRLVLELQESGLAALSADGMRGLARLASAGMSFCLSATRGRGPAAGMLTGLGFRFVMADAGFLSSGAMQEYAVGCLDGGIAVIAARVEDGHDAQTLLRDATLGFGPRFAPPRLVRKDVAPVAQSSAA